MMMSADLDGFIDAYAGNSIYDFDNEIILSWYPHRVIEQCSGATSLLELGLGHGFATAQFSRQFPRHQVIDGSPAVIAAFRGNYPDCKADIVETYFEQFETDERFDVIVMGFILEHVDDPVAVMGRFRKFLAPGGKMFVSVPNAEVLNRRLGHLAGMLEDMQELSDNDRLLGHQRYYTLASLTDDIVAAGYVLKSIEGIYLKPFTTGQMRSLNLDQRIIEALCLAGISYPELSCGILAQISPQITD